MDWQPIETAPKDGTYILLGGCKHGPAVRIGYWGPGRYDHRRREYERGWADGPAYGFNPTHWMPLPPAPTNRSEGGGDVK